MKRQCAPILSGSRKANRWDGHSTIGCKRSSSLQHLSGMSPSAPGRATTNHFVLNTRQLRAVRSFAEQNEPCVTDKRQQRIVILRAASQRLNHFADDCRVAHGQLFLLRANKQCATQAAIEASYSSVTLKVICSPRCLQTQCDIE